MRRGSHPLAEGLPEAWAVEWGEDPFGPFMSFGVGDVIQRMRWIPPGSFVMGSPEGEAGRFDDEVQHHVELRQGLWLADTPCTQALWEAVMGNNPSSFISPDRPVEQVSWDDCQVFLTKLNALIPGLDARLPTEAEWEYSCRGGTTTATWVGDLDIRGERNAPVLDAIAWYGGNSGRAFDLEEGYDVRDWPERQYPDPQAGTRRVRTKRVNPCGLYDMLGNVYEWCEDWYESYDVRSTVDPPGDTSGSERVCRGGSWLSNAGRVRAAFRRAYAPGYRDGYLGFRLARGPAPSQESKPELRSGEVSRGAGRDPAAAPTRDAAEPPATKIIR